MDDEPRGPIVITWALAGLCILLAGALTVVLVMNSSGAHSLRAIQRPDGGGSTLPTSSPSATPTPDPSTAPPDGGGGRGAGSAGGGAVGGAGGHGSGSGSVDQPAPSYTIGGTLAQPLRPGDSYPLDLVVTNLTGTAMTATHLRVTVSQVNAPSSSPSLPCTVSDFTVTQAADAFSVALGAHESTSLSARGVPSSQWPQIGMINSAANQDGCKNASLTLMFTGSSAVAP